MPFDYQMVTFEEIIKNDFFKWAQYIGWKNAIGFVGKRNRLRWQMKAASLADESGFVGR